MTRGFSCGAFSEGVLPGLPAHEHVRQVPAGAVGGAAGGVLEGGGGSFFCESAEVGDVEHHPLPFLRRKMAFVEQSGGAGEAAGGGEEIGAGIDEPAEHQLFVLELRAKADERSHERPGEATAERVDLRRGFFEGMGCFGNGVGCDQELGQKACVETAGTDDSLGALFERATGVDHGSAGFQVRIQRFAGGPPTRMP